VEGREEGERVAGGAQVRTVPQLVRRKFERCHKWGGDHERVWQTKSFRNIWPVSAKPVAKWLA